jgi:hypothetical protein
VLVGPDSGEIAALVVAESEPIDLRAVKSECHIARLVSAGDPGPKN